MDKIISQPEIFYKHRRIATPIREIADSLPVVVVGVRCKDAEEPGIAVLI